MNLSVLNTEYSVRCHPGIIKRKRLPILFLNRLILLNIVFVSILKGCHHYSVHPWNGNNNGSQSSEV